MASNKAEIEIKDFWMPVSFKSIIQFYTERAVKKNWILEDWAVDVVNQRILLHLYDFGKKKDG